MERRTKSPEQFKTNTFDDFMIISGKSLAMTQEAQVL